MGVCFLEGSLKTAGVCFCLRTRFLRARSCLVVSLIFPLFLVATTSSPLAVALATCFFFARFNGGALLFRLCPTCFFRDLPRLLFLCQLLLFGFFNGGLHRFFAAWFLCLRRLFFRRRLFSNASAFRGSFCAFFLGFFHGYDAC